MIAQTPPMGWNSWDCYGAAVDEPTVRQNAAYMAEHLQVFGWEYVVVDIQWYQPTATSHAYEPFAELTMDEYGRLQPAPGEPLPLGRGRQGLWAAGGIRPFAGAEIRHPHHARDAADGGASALADSGVREGLPRGRESKQHLRVESGYVRLAVRHARSARVL
mgnify:CR=1 FL=1